MIQSIRTGSQGFACLCSEDAPVYRIFRTIRAKALERGAKGGCFRGGSSGSKAYDVNGRARSPSGGWDVELSGARSNNEEGEGDDHGQQGDDWTGKRCAICPGG